MRYTAINDLPQIPPEIITAVNNRKLAVFIGAGVSRLVGCKSWGELASDIVDRCYRTRLADGRMCINFREKETLLRETDHKKTLTICFRLLKEAGLEDLFYKQLDEGLEAANPSLETSDVYRQLYRFSALFITTNVDEHFERQSFRPDRIAFREDDFDYAKIDRDKLYHIHGCKRVKDTLVFTVPQYLKRYANSPENIRFRQFLQRIFEHHVVLFLGYGMSEYEVLEYLISKSSSQQEQPVRHFFLKGFYRGEDNIFRIEAAYYVNLGITLVPYAMDTLGYEQLYEVIKSWSREIAQTSSYTLDSFREIEEIVDEV